MRRSFHQLLEALFIGLAGKYFEEVTRDTEVDRYIYIAQGEDNERLTLTKAFKAFGLVVPDYYSWNGASSPAIARLIIPKFHKMIKASCRHDRACELARDWEDRLRADIVFFLMALETEKLALWKCILGLVGVRIGFYLGIGKNY